MTDLGTHILPVARAVWGEPNRARSTKADVRWGSHGSRSVDLVKGTWFDHEAGEGGGVLDLIRRERGLSNGKAFDFLREIGCPVEDAPKSRPEPPRPAGKRVVATYDYVDADGELVLQVLRYEPKDFRQRRPDPNSPDGWSYSVRGIRLVPYRLPELLEDLGHERTVFLVEGEKAVDYLRAKGVPATCNPMGAGKWPEEFAGLFRGASVVIARDNNEAGHKHGALVADRLRSVARSIVMLDPPGVPDKAGLDDWMEANRAEADALYALAETEGYSPGQEPFRSRFRAVWLHEIANRETKLEWLVKGVVPARAFGAVVGQPGCGKSFLALDLAFTVSVLALTTDARWFGSRVNACGVVYIAAEGQDDFLNRAKALLIQHKVKPSPGLPFVLLPTGVDLRSAEGDTERLIAEIKAHAARMSVPLGLVVVDTLSRVMVGGDENSPEDMGALIKNLGRIQDATGAAVLTVHHKNASGDKARGHTSFQGALDVRLDVEKLETGGNVWSVQKLKCGPEGASHGFRLEQVKLGQDEDGDDITTCLVEPEGQANEVVRVPGKKLPESATVMLSDLFAVIGDRGRRVPIHGAHNLSGVTVEELWEFCKRKQPVDMLSDSFRRGHSRALAALQLAGRIGHRDGWVWPIPREAQAS